MEAHRISVRVFEGGSAVEDFTKVAFARLPAVGEFILVGSDTDRGFYEVMGVVHFLAGSVGSTFDTDVAAQVLVVRASWTKMHERLGLAGSTPHRSFPPEQPRDKPGFG